MIRNFISIKKFSNIKRFLHISRTKNFNNNLPIPDFDISKTDSIGTKLVITNSGIQTDQVFYSPLSALNNQIAPDGWRVPTKSDIENLLEGPYIELFARRKTKGWDAWGNEV